MTLQRLATHVRVPLFRSGYALAANTVISSGLGAVYWVVAARLLDAEAVGIGAAMISAMTLLTTVAAFNLDYGLNRFVPPAGAATSRLILGAYAAAVSLSAIAAIVFLAGLEWWAPALETLRTSPAAAAGFIGATMVWTVFVLQDAALAGLRRATWLPIENGAYGAAKLLLLVALVGLAGDYRVFVSWTLPLVAIVIPVNYLMFRFAIPAHVAATTEAAHPIEPRTVAAFAAKDFLASAMWRGIGSLLPLIVLELSGAEANAYFYLAWTIAYAIYLVSRATGVALITEGALEPGKLAAYSRQIIAQTGGLIVPVVLVTVIAAPLILSIFGPDYAREGTTVLRLLVLAAIPNMVVTLYVSIARVEQRMRSILYVNATMLAGVVGASFVLLPQVGLPGVGWAWLGTQTVLATALLATRLQFVWVPVVAGLPGIVRLAERLGPGRRLGKESAAAAAQIPDLLEDLGLGQPELDGLVLGESLPTELDLVVATLNRSQAPTAVIKLAATPGAGPSVEAEADTLAALHATPGLEEWLSLVPRLVDRGEHDGLPYFIESFVPGRSARDLATDPAARDLLTTAAAAAIHPLHAATATIQTIDADHVARWVQAPLEDLVHHLGGRDAAARGRQAARLGDAVAAELLGRETVVSRIHGDYWLGNLIVGEEDELAAIVDWAQSEECAMPPLDLLHLLLTARVLSHDQPFGPTMLTALTDPQWTAAESSLLEPIEAGSGPSLRTLIVLTWLRHVASNVRKSYRYRRSVVWMAQNVDDVLHAIA